MTVIKTKVCTKTGKLLPISDFRIHANGSTLSYSKAWEKEASKHYSLKKKHTFTFEDSFYTLDWSKTFKITYRKDGVKIGKKNFMLQFNAFNASKPVKKKASKPAKVEKEVQVSFNKIGALTTLILMTEDKQVEVELGRLALTKRLENAEIMVSI